MTTKRQSSAQVIAATFGADTRDIADYRYQPTRTKGRAVFAISERYLTCSATNPGDFLGMKWAEHRDQFFAKQAGTVLWVADEPGNA